MAHYTLALLESLALRIILYLGVQVESDRNHNLIVKLHVNYM